ncbi:hypothetical protein FOWG_04507 [Fusarium oxysporum f. sp. lycopersici MN25]|nr:hypothetical protein FOWG_04507 [Fusarium oxysporum f. sp. lycopersici MN25]
MTAEVDVISSAQITSWIEETVKRFDRLDGAVNSAGISAVQMGKGKIRDLADDSWALCVGINATGVFYSMRTKLNAMINGRSIINLASLASLIAVPRATEFSASKHAVVGLTKTGAREEGPTGIRWHDRYCNDSECSPGVYSISERKGCKAAHLKTGTSRGG